MAKDGNDATEQSAFYRGGAPHHEIGRGAVLLLGAITALSSLGIQMFVPALSAAAVALGTDRSGMQMAISVYLVILGIGQLPSGAAADAWGRLPVLRVGLALFLVGSVMAAWAQDLSLLLAGRALQAAGAAAGMVTGRALVTQGKHAARDIALLQAIVLTSPTVAPLIGGLLVENAGWRTIFVTLAGGGGLLLACSLFLVEPPHPPDDAGRVREGTWLVLLANPALGWNAAMAALTSAGLYSFLSIAPAVLAQRFGEPPSHVGLWLGLIALAGAAGAIWSSRLSGHVSSFAIKRRGCRLVAMSSALGLGACLLPFGHPLLLIAPMMLYTLGTGLILPNSTLAAMKSSPARPAKAASLYGLAHMSGGALAAYGTSFLPGTQTALWAALLLPGCMLPLMALRGL